jgi:YHS domain-containing protein
MSQTDLRSNKIRLLTSLLALAVAGPNVVVQQEANAAPPWGATLPQGTPDPFLGDLFVDPLLKKPFRMAPEDTPSGLAAKLKAGELDIPNKIKGIRYLATFHCATFPEAREMLVEVLLNDPWEPVRLEAATALRDMFQNCGCNEQSGDDEQCKLVDDMHSKVKTAHADLDTKAKHVHATMDAKFKALLKGDVCAVIDPHWIHPLFQHKVHVDRLRGAPDADTCCQCKCCCNAETLNKLAKVAYETKDDGCCFEPSRRVREMAVAAIAACGIPCHYKPYAEGDEHGPPAYDTDEPDKDVDRDEVLPDVVPAPGEQLPDSSNRMLNLPRSANYTPVPNARLKKVCLVSLKQGQKTAPTGKFARAYRGRTYQFASEAAMKEFERNPEEYAVAFGGCDPVHFVETREVVEGRFLMTHNGRFYMFATRQNLELFKAGPERYTMKQNGDRSTGNDATSPGRKL